MTGIELDLGTQGVRSEDKQVLSGNRQRTALQNSMYKGPAVGGCVATGN